MIRKLLTAVLRPPVKPAEPVEARTVALLQELIDSQETIGRLKDDLSEERHSAAEARRELDVARLEIGRLLIQLEAGDRAVQPWPVPRSVSLELALARERADALGARVHQAAGGEPQGAVHAWNPCSAACCGRRGRLRGMILWCVLRRDVACCSVCASGRHKAHHENQGAQQP